MNADQKKRIAHEISNWKNACNCRAVQLTGDRMAALLQELVDTPEPEPFGYFKAEPFGWTDCAETDDGAIALYTAPPAPSVPDEQLQAAFDRGLKAGNEQAIAQQIEIHKLHDLLAVQQPEQPTDLARDAERYRWLGEPWGGRWSLVIEGPCPDGDESSGAIDKAIDAARERQEGGDQATLRDCATKGRAVMVGGGTIKCEVLPDGGQS